VSVTVVRVFVPFALGYLLSYLLRVVNAVIAPSLIEDLGLNASDLGLLTSANLFAFAAFQIPLGVLLDRYGPRKTESVLLIVAAIGTAMFAMAGSLAMLALGRALIGLGTSSCLMAAFTAYALWLSETLETITGWRGVFWVLTGIAVFMAAVVYFIVPQRADAKPTTETWSDALFGVKRVFTSPLFWRVAPLCVTSQAAFIGIQSLWLGPWFHDVLKLDTGATADALFWVAAAMVASYVCLAWVTRFFGDRGVSAIRISVSGMVIFLIVQILVVAEIVPVTVITWMVWVFAATYGVVCYAGLTQRFPIALAGRLVTGINVLAFFAAFLVQWGVGLVIDLWPMTESGGFHPDGYRSAFGIVAAVQLVAFIWFLSFRDERIADSHV